MLNFLEIFFFNPIKNSLDLLDFHFEFSNCEKNGTEIKLEKIINKHSNMHNNQSLQKPTMIPYLKINQI